ncbi:hypothetical protein D3C85_1063000 [compost metagenome]
MTNQEFNQAIEAVMATYAKHANVAKVLASGVHNATCFEDLCEIATYNWCEFGDTAECVECFENSLEAMLSA